MSVGGACPSGPQIARRAIRAHCDGFRRRLPETRHPRPPRRETPPRQTGTRIASSETEGAMMPPPRTHRFHVVLAAVDFSRQSAKAIRYAVALARAGGGRVVAVHAIDPLLAGAAARAYAERTLIQDT